MKRPIFYTKLYNDPAGYGSMKNTLADAKEIDPSIKLDDVKDFLNKYVEQKKQAHGTNSFVANGAKYEYQIDLILKHIYRTSNTRLGCYVSTYFLNTVQ